MERGAKVGAAIAVVVGLAVVLTIWLFVGATPTFSEVASPEPTPDDVVKAFEDEGLTVENPRPVEDDPEWGTGMLPKTMDAGTRFDLSEYAKRKHPATVDVFHFASSEDQQVVSGYLDKVSGSSGMFYIHVYETDGFLLKIDGNVPKPEADRYGEVLKTF